MQTLLSSQGLRSTDALRPEDLSSGFSSHAMSGSAAPPEPSSGDYDAKPTQMSFYMNPDFALEDPSPHASGFVPGNPRSRSPSSSQQGRSTGEAESGHIAVRHPSLSSPGDWRALSQQVARDAKGVWKRRPSVQEALESEGMHSGRRESDGGSEEGVSAGDIAQRNLVISTKREPVSPVSPGLPLPSETAVARSVCFLGAVQQGNTKTLLLRHVQV
jgi:hypothetical protein